MPHKLLKNLAVESRLGDEALIHETIDSSLAQQLSLIGGLFEKQLVTEHPFLREICSRFGLPWWDAALPPMDDTLRSQFPARLALRYHLYPVRLNEHGLYVLTYDPFNLTARQVVAREMKEPITWCVATRRNILAALRSGYGVGAETFDAILEGRDVDDAAFDVKQEVNVLDEEDPEATVVSFVNQIMREALDERATDIHIEPLENDLRIRYRIDGVLHEAPVPSRIKVLQASVISRVKIMAHLDIAERRMPQDGRINLEMEGQPIDVRVATIPTVSGESISLRLLARNRFDFSLLGLTPETERKIRELIAQPNGIILLTGPTGCGKSTSLYTFLSMLNTMERRIVTVEDPVEHKLPGVMQIAIKPEINLTFATALRSILRGDPNVIMIGEMRDFETAEIAIRAALTGHLVFSTLHTNDAIGGITRLIDMGVQPFLVSSSVRAFLAQRLVRVLCPHCKAPASHKQPYLEQIGFPMAHADRILQAKGCEECRQTGYQGRAALFEIVMVTPALQEMISRGAAGEALRAKALQEGMVPLRQDGWNRVIAGTTTVEEVVRVTAADLETLDE
ncbi:MAG: Flp pilus assembly complex ATPase component TadA [Methylacidiphilales bacterium]|nr:Flp pilus assembly complex ATPase component TadA [Candidatus Methylacidiphilales bacterium]